MIGWIILLILTIGILLVSIILIVKESHRSMDQWIEHLDKFVGMHDTADGNDGDAD